MDQTPPCKPSSLVCLNVGFGMGLIDRALEAHKPKRHVIVEAHPQIYKRALAWSKDLNHVTVVHSMWQDVKLQDLGPFDAVYFDTYEETVDEFMTLLPSIMAPRGRFCFFNGSDMCSPVNTLVSFTTT